MIARTGIVLAVLQLAFALTWVVYVAYLPALAAQVGLPASVVPWLLLADQAIFVVCDWTAGVFADRLEASVARLGLLLALVTVASCAAFLAVPFVAPIGSAPLLVALVVVWSATSSMLRAPALSLAGRQASRPQRTWLAGLYLLGFGAGGAVAPGLAKTLATTDPRIPFVATSVIVAVMTLVLAALPRAAVTAIDPAGEDPRPTGKAVGVALVPFAVAVLLFAIGFQIHGSINSIPMYLRHATRDQLTVLLPVFWLGFNVAMLVVMIPVRRAGGLVVVIGGGVIGAAALLVARLADSLALLVAAQAFAGVAWAGILGGAFAATTTLARKPGGATGLVFSMLAGAAVLRIALVSTVLPGSPAVAPLLPMIPPVAWMLGAVLVATFAFRRHR